MQANWTEENCNFSVIIMSSAYTNADRPVQFYRTTGNFTDGTQTTSTQMAVSAAYKSIEFGTAGYYTTKNAVQKDGYAYFMSSYIDTNYIVMSIYRYKTELEVIWRKNVLKATDMTNKANMVMVNGQIFAWLNVANDITDPSFSKKSGKEMAQHSGL